MGLPFIGNLVGGVAKIIDDLHTSDDERLTAKARLTALQIEMNSAALDYESGLIKEASKIIQTEAASSSWLAANWRPLVMIAFTLLIVAHWLGFTAENLTEAEILSLLGLVKLGLGGYVIGRSAEKVIPATIAAMKKKENA